MLIYRHLTAEDLPQMEALAASVMEALPDKRWYYYLPGDPECWLREGVALGCLDGERLAGVAAYSPAENRMEESYAAILGEETSLTLDWHDVMVSPNYRRRGIHRRFSELIRGEAEARGCRGVYLTIDPDNLPSRRAFEEAGYRCLRIQPAYDGRTRCYYRLSLMGKE